MSAMIYLDNAATSFPKPEPVYQAVLHAMREIGVSPGRGSHSASLEAARLLFRARETLAEFFGIPDSSRLVFTHNATAALNQALWGALAPGDHVITSSMEHNSLLRPLFALQRTGVELTVVEAGPDGLVDPDRIRGALRPATRMVAVSHVSNVCGCVQDITAIAEVCRGAGVLFLLDAAQSAGSLPIDVRADGIDLLAAPGHKGLLGPQGTGILYVAEQLSLKPLLSGGTGTNSTADEQPRALPEGLEAGTHNLPGIAGLMAGVEFIRASGLDRIGAQERRLAEELREGLSALPGVALTGPADPVRRGGVVSFTVAGIDPSLLAAELDLEFRIAVRAGLHCAPRAHQTLGTFPGGTVRVSPGWSTTREDIAFFRDAVIQCLKKLGQ